MGVYVPNIKKPKHCTECYFVSRDQCELQDNSYDYDTFKEQRKHCPLIEIPTPHGRLIDGDKLSIEFENQCAGECADCMFEERCVIIDRIAPTILEAEE